MLKKPKLNNEELGFFRRRIESQMLMSEIARDVEANTALYPNGQDMATFFKTLAERYANETRTALMGSLLAKGFANGANVNVNFETGDITKNEPAPQSS